MACVVQRIIGPLERHHHNNNITTRSSH